MPDPILSLDSVSFSKAIASQLPLQGALLLQDISFDVNAGEFVAIVGPSGAGKTSLLRLLNRLSEVTQGQIWFNLADADAPLPKRQDLRHIPVIQLRQRVVLVLQEAKLLGMTVAETLAYPLKLQGFKADAIQQRLTYWQNALHLPSEWLNRTELELSVGQRQLVTIARGLMLQPQILLLDEPTSALDAGRCHQVLTLLKSLTETQSLTVLMVTHQIEWARQFASRLLYLEEGRLQKDQYTTNLDWDGLRDRLIQAEAITADWEE